MKMFRFSLLPALLVILFLAAAPRGSANSSATRRTEAFKTTITVTSGADPDTSTTKTCASDAPCTLRRAIVQANALPLDKRPALIQFNMPATAGAGYVQALQAWRIQPQASAAAAVFPALELGGITIDASTQPNGRSDGPAVILTGPWNGSKDGLVAGLDNSGLHDSNEIIGFAFQNFRDHVLVYSSLNLALDNWFGLADRGERAYLRGGSAQNGSGRRGVLAAEATLSNVIDANYFLGFADVAVDLDGDGNLLLENFVGTDGNGEVPGKQTAPGKLCSEEDWLGGGGVRVDGAEHLVANNTLAGLRREGTTSSQPEALRVSGAGHEIEDNAIGVDFAGREVGVCGQGVVLAGPREVLVSGNTLADTVLSSMVLDGGLYDANRLFGNVIRRERPWPEAENAVQFGQQLPQALKNFAPARVTGSLCTVVRGTNGFGSPCPNCRVEVFLDDRDNVTEALQSLAVTTADANGNWQATLRRPLAGNEGLRTMSTTFAANTVPGISGSTTSGLSPLYLGGLCGYLPIVRGN